MSAAKDGDEDNRWHRNAMVISHTHQVYGFGTIDKGEREDA